MKRLFSMFLAVLMILLILVPATSAMAETKKQKVSVVVKDYTGGKGLKSASYTIKNSKGTVVKTGKTDSNGKVSASLTPGKYTLSASLSCYANGSKSFTVTKGKDASVSLSLKKYAKLSITFKDKHGDYFSGSLYVMDDADNKVIYDRCVGSSGKATVSLKPDHTYKVFAYDPKGRSGQLSCTIKAKPGKTYSKAPSFTPDVKIRVTLIDVNGYAVPYTRVQISSLGISDSTGGKGVAVLKGLPYGKTVTVSSERAGSKSVKVTGKNGSYINITLKANYRQLKLTTQQVEKPKVTTDYIGNTPVKTEKPLDYME